MRKRYFFPRLMLALVTGMLSGCLSISLKGGGSLPARLEVQLPLQLQSGRSFSIWIESVPTSAAVSLAFTDAAGAPVSVSCIALTLGKYVCTPPFTFSGLLQVGISETEGGRTTSYRSAIQFIDASQEGQQIVIDVKITDAAGNFVAEVSNDASKNSGSLSLTAGETYHFDLSGSEYQGAPVSEDTLSFSESLDGSSLQDVSGLTFDHPFPVAVSSIAGVVQADTTDALGNTVSRQLTISLSTQCNGVPAMDLSQGAITVADSNVLGFYDYTVNLGSSAGGVPPYSVSFDLNGDGIFPDLLSMPSGSVSSVSFSGSSVTVPSQFTIYRYILPPGAPPPSLGATPPYLIENPLVQATIRDACGQTGTIKRQIAFDQSFFVYHQYAAAALPSASSAAGVDGWAQAEFSGGPANLEPSANAVVVVAHSTSPSPDGVQRVTCTYDPGTGQFDLSALSAYSAPVASGVTPAHQQGLTLKINSGLSPNSFASLSGTLAYITDGSPDPALPQVHSYSGSVPVFAQVTSSTTSISCTGGSTGSQTIYSVAWVAGSPPGSPLILTDTISAAAPSVALEPFTAAGWCQPSAVKLCP